MNAETRAAFDALRAEIVALVQRIRSLETELAEHIPTPSGHPAIATPGGYVARKLVDTQTEYALLTGPEYAWPDREAHVGDDR